MNAVAKPFTYRDPRYVRPEFQRFHKLFKQRLMVLDSAYALPFIHPRRFNEKIYLRVRTPDGRTEVPSLVWFVLGIRGAGKSSFLEYLGEHYLRVGCSIVDIFGSRDGEGLAWLRSPWAEVTKVLVLHSPDAEVMLPLGDAMPYTEFRKEDAEKYDIIIMAAPLYVKNDEEFEAANHIIDQLYQRFHWHRPLYMIVREAARLLYSRHRTVKNQTLARNQMINLIREFRHMGISMGIDTQKFTSVDKDVRVQSDYIIIKRLGQYTLPEELRWLYRIFAPEVLTRLQPHEFIIVSKTGFVGMGIFSFPTWHKMPNEDILEELKIEVIKKEGKTTKKEKLDIDLLPIRRVREETGLSYRIIHEIISSGKIKVVKKKDRAGHTRYYIPSTELPKLIEIAREEYGLLLGEEEEEEETEQLENTEVVFPEEM